MIFTKSESKKIDVTKEAPERRDKLVYPCLCGILRYLLCMTRLLGILPISIVRKNGHVSSCEFVNEKIWMRYSLSIQCLYSTYILIIYGLRFYSGPVYHLKSEWYVMTIGYFMSDMETLITIIVGTVSSKRICDILNTISKMQGFSDEAKLFKKKLRIIVTVSLGIYFCIFISHIHVALLRFDETEKQLLDTTPFVMMRSIGMLYTAVEVIIVFGLNYLIVSKYRYLANMTSRVMHHLYIQYDRKNYDYSPSQCTELVVDSTEDEIMIPKMHHLETYNHHLERIIYQFNKAMGLSILVVVTSSLYTTIYYLYRLCTASDNSVTSNNRERIHYIIGLIVRSGKLLSYMLMGNQLLTNSQQPLEVIRKSRTINLPMETQHQVQTLMLQWLNNRRYLSAGGIINVGPWLLAPIVGNVITYLLVALQFNQVKQQQ